MAATADGSRYLLRRAAAVAVATEAGSHGLGAAEHEADYCADGTEQEMLGWPAGSQRKPVINGPSHDYAMFSYLTTSSNIFCGINTLAA